MRRALLLAVATALTPSQVATVIANTEKAFHYYIFPDVAATAVAMLHRNEQSYEAISDPKILAQTVDRDLLAVTHDKHVSLLYPFDPVGVFGNDTSAAALQARHRDELLDNFGFVSVRRLPGNVGYIDFSYFSDDSAVGQTIAATMAFLGNTDALIIDLRHNGGGSPIAAQTLEAYFFRQQQQITSIIFRNPETGETKENQQSTASTVPGPLYLDKPLYILTSGHTYSCAEQFTYDLHNLKRATVVGETTGGAANPGDVHSVGAGFAVFIPDGRAYSPVTKGNWEGTGIAPDMPAPAPLALGAAYGAALNYVKAHETNADVLDSVKRALADPAKALAAPQ